MYSPSLPAKPLGIRESFADIGKTTLAWLNLESPEQRGRNMLGASLETSKAALV
jgi:phosphopentomutase